MALQDEAPQIAPLEGADVRLRTLGGLEVVGRDFKRTKPLLLLSYLCVEGKKERRHIADLFWQDAKDPKASLATELSRLRKTCGDVVYSDGTRVWTTLKTDVEVVLGALEQGDLAQAVTAYEGAFLAGVYLDGWAAELEEWVYTTREFLAGRVCEAHLHLAEREARTGDFAAGARAAARACTVPGLPQLEPEQMPRAHALLVAGTHPRAEEVARSALDYGLRLELTPTQARTRLRPAVRPLPTRGTSFVGRAEEMWQVETSLQQEDCRLLSIVGLAGMGKTRLALEAANRMLQKALFPDGVYLVKLETLLRANDLPYQVANALGHELKGDTPPLQAVAEAIGGRHMLVVLDTFEHLMDAVMSLPELLSRCPNLHLLVTSRERLNVAEEYVVWLEGLPFETAVDANETFTLFVDRARRHRQEFRVSASQASASQASGELSEDNKAAILEICRLVAGSPLATELVASLVNVLSCQQLAESLRQDAMSLSTQLRNLPARQTSLEAAFETSWQLLNEAEQRVLAGLAVFRGGFTREAAEQVVGAGLSALVALTDKTLLRPQPQGRFDRHPLLFQFAAQKLANQPEFRAATRRSHAEYFTAFVEQRLAPIRGGQAGAVAGELDRELDNIRQAWHFWLEQAEPAELAKGVFTLAYFFEFGGRSQEGLDLFEATLQKLTLSPETRLAVAKLHYASSWMLDYLGRTDQALSAAKEALEHYRAHGDPGLVAHGLNNLAGFVADRTGDFERAATLLEEAHTLVASDDGRRAAALTNLGGMYIHGGDYARAEAYLSEAKTLHTNADNQMGIAICLANQGELYLLTGEPERAETALSEGLALCRTLQLKHFLPHLLYLLTRLWRLRGDVEQAERHVTEALTVARDTGNDNALPGILVEYARVDLANHRADAALGRLGEALRVADSGGFFSATLEVVVGLSDYFLHQEQYARASELASYVSSHPRSYASFRAQAQTILTKIPLPDTELAPPKVEHATLVETLKKELPTDFSGAP